RLAGAVGPEQTQDLSAPRGEREVVDCGYLAEPLGQALDLDDALRGQGFLRNERDRAQRTARATRDLHRQRHDPRARLGNALEPGQVLQTRNVRSGDETMHGEVARGAVVDRGRVEADRADAPFPDEEAYRLRAERREVQV